MEKIDFRASSAEILFLHCTPAQWGGYREEWEDGDPVPEMDPDGDVQVCYCSGHGRNEIRQGKCPADGRIEAARGAWLAADFSSLGETAVAAKIERIGGGSGSLVGSEMGLKSNFPHTTQVAWGFETPRRGKFFWGDLVSFYRMEAWVVSLLVPPQKEGLRLW